MAKIAVAPLVGAWIEINPSPVSVPGVVVAPLVGAWIEIGYCGTRCCHHYVAPLVGAWIEIHFGVEQVATTLRRSPRGSVD